MKKFIFFFLLMYSSGGFAQYYLLNFFQKNYDSTIIYFSNSNWDMFPNYFILSKKNKSIYAFTYTKPGRRFVGRKNYNRDSLMKYRYEDSIFISTPLDSNQFLKTFPAEQIKLDSLWKYLIANNIFNLKDDSDFGDGCKKVAPANRCYVFDAGFVNFYLIDKTKTHRLVYYAPEYFETKCCPGVPERKIIMKIAPLIRNLLTGAE